MDRLISEQKVLEAIDNLKANFTCYDSVTLDEVASHVKAIPSADNWIPVSEKLPEDGDYVLVCYANGHIRTAYYYIDTNIYPSEFEDCCETGWYNYNEDFMYEQDVIEWQPLPSSYNIKENRNEKINSQEYPAAGI